ncbi:SURF1 family protein, partial [Streptomyces albidoflavus]
PQPVTPEPSPGTGAEAPEDAAAENRRSPAPTP